MTPYQAYVYYNMYILKNMFFKGEIIEISQKQYKELKHIYETPMLIKLKLNKTFSKKLLHARKVFLRLGLL